MSTIDLLAHEQMQSRFRDCFYEDLVKSMQQEIDDLRLRLIHAEALVEKN